MTPPPRARIDESMEALIHHFKLFTEGSRCPRARCTWPSSPPAVTGLYIASDGRAKPWRSHIRAQSFVNLQMPPHMIRGRLVADTVAIISSVDPVLGDVDR